MVKGSNVLWTDAELVSAVDAYVFMLQAQRAGLPNPKDVSTQLLLSGPLSIRNDASLRYRMRNISAVVSEMGVPFLAVYSPAEQVGTNKVFSTRTLLQIIFVLGAVVVNRLTAGFQVHTQSALFCRSDRNNVILLFSLGMSFTLVVAVRSARKLAQIDVDDRGCEQRNEL